MVTDFLHPVHSPIMLGLELIIVFLKLLAHQFPVKFLQSIVPAGLQIVHADLVNQFLVLNFLLIEYIPWALLNSLQVLPLIAH